MDISSIFVLWIAPIIALANEGPLKSADIPDLSLENSVAKSNALIWNSWLAEKEKAHASSRTPNYMNALLEAYKPALLFSGTFQFLFMLAQLCQPILVGELVAFIDSSATGKNIKIQTGVALAVALGLISLFSSVCISVALGANRTLGANMRAGIMMNVYEHSLELSFTARSQNSQGQTTNLVSIDSEKFFLALQFMHFLWQGPLTSILAMLLLIRDVGYQPAMAGLGFVLFLIPVQNIIASSIGNIRREMVKKTDSRVSLINESMQTIRLM
jgi:ABC-type multidrug transport system fused ATPase/permease subunit